MQTRPSRCLPSPARGIDGARGRFGRQDGHGLLADAHRQTVCGMNLALLEQAAASPDGTIKAVLDPGPGLCCVALVRDDAAGAGAGAAPASAMRPEPVPRGGSPDR